MSWFSNAAIASKRLGLYLRKAAGAAPPAGIVYRPTFAAMDFAAVYQAFAPGIVGEVGGTLDPATAGANVTLSGGNLIATFSGAGSVLGTIPWSVGGGDQFAACEFLVTAGGFSGFGTWSDNGVPYDPDLLSGGNAPDSVTYNLDGTCVAFTPGVPPVLVPGDVVGLIWDSAGAAASFAAFFLNGVDQGGPPLAQWFPGTLGFPMLTHT